MRHPSFSYYSASHCLHCLCGKKWAVPLVKVHLLRIQWDRLKIFACITDYLHSAATHACLQESSRWTQTACKAIGYTLSHYHSTHPTHHSALDRNINLQHFFSSLFFLPVHCMHPNQVQQSSRCCLHVGCNATRWPSGWHQTWRCETSPLGAVVWLEQ